MLTLSSLAVAQPLLDLLGRNAEFFVVRRAGAGEILLLVLTLLVLVPLPLIVFVGIVKLIDSRQPIGSRLGGLIESAVIGALAALLILLTLTRSRLLDGAPWLAAGLAAGLVVALAYRRFSLGTLLYVISPVLLAIPALFLLRPQILKIAFPRTSAELQTSGARSPIVFLLFDELSLTALLDEDRRIDRRNYPNLAALADEATWFANATTVSDTTELAVPAILSGNLPEKGRLPVLNDYPQNLFTAFGDYEIWAAEPITQLCPSASNRLETTTRPPRARLRALAADLWIVYRHLLLPPRYAARLPTISDRWQAFGQAAADVRAPQLEANFTQAAIEALKHDRQEDLRHFTDLLDPEIDSALYFLHVLLPHAPWEYLPSGKVYPARKDRIPGLAKEIWHDDPSFTVQAYRRYLLQTRFLDRWLGELIARLRELDLYDRSLIVFAADHGVSFRPGDSRRLLTPTNAHDLIPVPLLIKSPFQHDGQVVERPVSTLDVLPTMLDLLDVDPPWPLAGRSAFAEDDSGVGEPRRVIGKYRDLDLDGGFDARKYATLDWKLETFGAGDDGPGDDSPDFWRAGAHPDLYGRRTEDLGWREQDAVTLRLESETSFQQYAAADVFTPAFISGLLETSSADTDCCDLAVAVNGIVRSTVRAYGSTPYERQFSALVPDAAFRAGENRIDIFRVRSAGPRPVLEHLGPDRRSWSLEADAEGRVIALEQEGRRLPIEPGALAGFAESMTHGSRITVFGWAADRGAAAAAEQILAFHEGTWVGSSFATGPRPDVAAGLDLDPATRSAFQLQIPHASVPHLARSGVRLFATSKSAASELGFFYELESREDGSASKIRLTNGREIPVVDDALAGSLDEIVREGSQLILRGWAADLKRREPAQRILAFSNGKLIAESQTFHARADVAEDRSRPEILLSGFEQKIALADDAVPARPRVLAVARHGEATELHVPGGG